MMNNNEITEIIVQLYSAHQQLNRILFKNRLEDINIRIETNRRHTKSNLLGRFDPSQLWSNKKNEITIWTLAFNGDYINILSVLVHEMVHQYNFEKGIQDTFNNQRHNKQFKKIAQIVLLEVQKPYDHYGYAYTQPSEKLIKVFENRIDIDRKIFSIIHKDSLHREEMKYENKFTRYVCKNCLYDIFIRTKDIQFGRSIICGKCDKKFIPWKDSGIKFCALDRPPRK